MYYVLVQIFRNNLATSKQRENDNRNQYYVQVLVQIFVMIELRPKAVDITTIVTSKLSRSKIFVILELRQSQYSKSIDDHDHSTNHLINVKK